MSHRRFRSCLQGTHVPHRSENIDTLRRFAEIEGLAPHVNTEIDRLKSMDYRISVATDSAFQDSAVSPRLLIQIGRLEVGDPADRILKCIDKENIDCVIMGSRGLNDLKGLFLCSVSHKIANRAPCTCIAVK